MNAPRKTSPIVKVALVALLGASVLSLTVPQWLQSRYRGSESGVPALLRAYVAAQHAYREANCAGANGLDPNSFYTSYRFLGGVVAHRDGDGKSLRLIRGRFADAKPPWGCEGMFFVDATTDLESRPVDPKTGFGLYAHAVAYGEIGKRSFCVFADGRIYVADPGRQVPAGTEEPEGCKGQWKPIDGGLKR